MVQILALIISYSSSVIWVVSTIVLIIFWKKIYKYKLIFGPRLLFVLGLVFSRAVAEYGITSVLAWYFTYYGDHLVMSSVLSNIQSSLSSLLVIFVAHSADSYVGRFRTLLFSNTAYIWGMMILWLFNPYDVKWLVVISLVLLSLGTSGANTLDDILEDMVNDIQKSRDQNEKGSQASATMLSHDDENEIRSQASAPKLSHDDENEIRCQASATMLSRIAYTAGAITAILWVTTDSVGGAYPSWRSSFFICVIIMTVTSFIFCLGHNKYHQGELKDRPIVIFFRVYGGPIKKLFNYCSWRSVTISRQNSSSKNLETKNIGQEVYTKENDMKVIKSLLRMLPMWVMFFVVSIISATGATFFQQQYTNLNVNNKIPIQIYNIVQDFSRFATPLLYSKIHCFSENEKTKKEKVRIGIGMLCGILSCVFAWLLEVHRLKEVGYLVDKELNTSISFLWLVPQYCVLGCMEGLTREGALKLYKLQMGKQRQLKTYGEEYIEVVTGLGTLMNILLVLSFNKVKGWFGDTINDSRLDKYYKFLACVCVVNFVLFCCIAICKYKEQGLADDDQEQDNQEGVADENQEQDNPEGMANDDHGQDNDQVWADDDQEQDN